MKGFQAAKRRPFYADSDDGGQYAATDAVAKHQVDPQQQDHQVQPGDPQSRQQDTPAAGGLEEQQPRRTAGFIREHGPLALITVMSAGATALAHSRMSAASAEPCHVASPARASPHASRFTVWEWYSACETCHLCSVPIVTMLHAGHMIPIDQPRSALRMVRMIMDRHSQVSGGQQPARPADIMVDSTI